MVKSICPSSPPVAAQGMPRRNRERPRPYRSAACVCGSRLTYSESFRMSRMFQPKRFAVVALALIVAAPALVRAQMDPSLFAGLHWRSIGPNRGGRSQTAAGSASRPLEYYFGGTGGGVWKTTDRGLTGGPL